MHRHHHCVVADFRSRDGRRQRGEPLVPSSTRAGIPDQAGALARWRVEPGRHLQPGHPARQRQVLGDLRYNALMDHWCGRHTGRPTTTRRAPQAPASRPLAPCSTPCWPSPSAPPTQEHGTQPVSAPLAGGGWTARSGDASPQDAQATLKFTPDCARSCGACAPEVRAAHRQAAARERYST